MMFDNTGEWQCCLTSTVELCRSNELQRTPITHSHLLGYNNIIVPTEQCGSWGSSAVHFFSRQRATAYTVLYCITPQRERYRWYSSLTALCSQWLRMCWWFCDVDLMRRQEELNRLEEKAQMEIQRRMEMRSVAFIKHYDLVFNEASLEVPDNRSSDLTLLLCHSDANIWRVNSTGTKFVKVIVEGWCDRRLMWLVVDKCGIAAVTVAAAVSPVTLCVTVLYLLQLLLFFYHPVMIM